MRKVSLLEYTVFFGIVGVFAFFQFQTVEFYGIDEYYHLRIAEWFQKSGIFQPFPWGEFSTFKDTFSDKELLFHFFLIPFLFLLSNGVVAGKCALLVLNCIFLGTYGRVIKNYVPPFLGALLLLAPFFSPGFCINFLFMRPGILANILTLWGCFALIHSHRKGIFVVSVLYPLCHVSFPMLILFAALGEGVRFVCEGKWKLGNIGVCFFGMLLGCLIHPHFPNNLLSVYWNFFLVPLEAMKAGGTEIFGEEMVSLPTKMAFTSHALIFLSLNLILWTLFLKKIKVTFETCAWWMFTSVYLLLAFMGKRYWYQTGFLFFVFFASWIKDWAEGRDWDLLLPCVKKWIFAFALIGLLIIPINLQDLKNEMVYYIAVNMRLREVGEWMHEHIPEGKIVYHSSWSDSSALMYFNPKNSYFMELDPIYMIQKNADQFKTYQAIGNGMLQNPAEVLKKQFHSEYGFVRNTSGLYYKVMHSPAEFQVLFQNKLGVVFKILS